MKKFIRLAPLTMVLLVLTSCGESTKLEAAEAKKAWDDANSAEVTEIPNTIEAKVYSEGTQSISGSSISIKDTLTYRIDEKGNVSIDIESTSKAGVLTQDMNGNISFVDSIAYFKVDVNAAGLTSQIKVKGSVDDVIDASGMGGALSSDMFSISGLMNEIQELIKTAPDKAGIVFEDVEAYVKGDSYTFEVKNETGEFSIVYNGKYFESVKASSKHGKYEVKIGSYSGTIKISNPDSYLDASSFQL